jgi:hypothetical protein
MATNQNCIHEGIKSVKYGGCFVPCIQNILSSCVLSKNIKKKVKRTIILPVVWYGCETWFLKLREKHILMAGEHCIMRGSIICTVHQILLGQPNQGE